MRHFLSQKNWRRKKSGLLILHRERLKNIKSSCISAVFLQMEHRQVKLWTRFGICISSTLKITGKSFARIFLNKTYIIIRQMAVLMKAISTTIGFRKHWKTTKQSLCRKLQKIFGRSRRKKRGLDILGKKT